MARTLLKEKPKVPETRRVRFHASTALADRMDALIARAQQAGFDMDLDAAPADAQDRAESPAAQTEPGAGGDFGTAA